MHKPSAALLLAATLLTACSDTDAPINPGAPSMVGRLVSPIEVHPASLSPELVRDALCPFLPPFLLPLSLTVTANEDVNVSITGVRFRFVDALGVPMPQVTLTQPMLTTQFGSTLVLARSSRTFPLTFRFGCDTASAGTLVIVVDTRDDRGIQASTLLRATVK